MCLKRPIFAAAIGDRRFLTKKHFHPPLLAEIFLNYELTNFNK